MEKNLLKKLKDFSLDLLFPRFCLGCGAEGTYLCDDCKAILEISENKYCLCENFPLRLPSQERTGKCKKCSSRKLSGLYFSLSYKEKSLTKKLIHFFKYEPYFLKDLASSLAGLITDHLSLAGENKKALFENSVFIPVPIDRKK